MIPDAEFKPVEVEILPELVENNQPEKESFVVQGFDMTDYSPEQREQVAKFLNAKVQQLTEAYKSEAQAELERAKAEAETTGNYKARTDSVVGNMRKSTTAGN